MAGMSRKNPHVYWRYPNGWRKYCDRWWLHWLQMPSHLWWDLKDFFQRGRRGWANMDVGDLDDYHAGLTLGMLKHFREVMTGYIDGMTKEQYAALVDSAIDAWEAKIDLLREDSFTLDWEKTPKDEYYAAYNAWREALEQRWKRGMVDFIEIYDSLWT
jgi:hypothetical protein